MKYTKLNKNVYQNEPAGRPGGNRTCGDASLRSLPFFLLTCSEPQPTLSAAVVTAWRLLLLGWVDRLRQADCSACAGRVCVNRTVKKLTLRARFARRSAGAGCILTLAMLSIGCAVAPVQTPTPRPSFRLVVLDFRVPDTWRDPEKPDQTKKELRGWWFSSRKLWHNPGWGRLAGDVFWHEINRQVALDLLPSISLVSRVDTRYYMAEKDGQIHRVLAERLRKLETSADPHDREKAERIRAMSAADYERMLERLPSREIGRELNADRVLVGRIHEAYRAHNRTIGWYWSYMDLEVDLVDVDTGKVIWRRRAPFKKNLASTSRLFETAARKMVEWMKREYFYQP